MKQRASTLLQVPAGSSALFFNEARAHQRAVKSLSALYDSWAYVPVHTPLLDFSHPYQGIMSEADQQKVYHLVGRDGAILMLRWDVTLFLVKQIQSLIGDAPLPLRLSYADAILRHQEQDDISRNEYFQTGAELIGSRGPDGDLEVVLLLTEALASLGLKGAIHIGSRALFEAIFEGQDPRSLEELARAISLRDYHSLRQLMAEAGFTGKTEAVCELFSRISRGKAVAETAGALGPSLPPAARKELDFLADLVRTLDELRPECEFRLDCSELGSQRYHSGIVFQAYLDGVASPVATGGRYDRLLETMGCPQAAVGFSIMLSKITPLLAPHHDHEIHRLGPADGDFATRYRTAHTLRAAGKKVSL